MKSGLRELIGKTLADVIVARNDHRDPANQVLLVFDDGTYFEFRGRSSTATAASGRAA